MAIALLRNLQALEMPANEPTAKWKVPLSDGTHVVEFEHGTATGKRVVRVDGKILVHRDWMFRLVGDEVVNIGKNKLVIRVDPIPGLKYSYTLWVNGKSFSNFIQAQSKILKSWSTEIGGTQYRIVLDKNTQAIWVNGHQVNVENEFVDGGAEMSFSVGLFTAVIRSSSTGEREIRYVLYVDDIEIIDQEKLE
ncbi:fas apoptotic inhibitory molecule 1 isoform X2 [Belonocnema kinseyi]|uniref:fas apoptotic inhibitory molecule 1 isoform X2 n=1 Tax=Belonocnema kinseyi TaxID=2817044 RepID=UPI00143DC9F9|nr:fas apoptotic inhibitory molecule 1 isoform X2 [Belonocnema kinseyi]